MCGISGWVNFSRDISGEKKIIEKMTETLIPRGPDAKGFYLSNHALLGHRRLSVIDPANGAQPMTGEGRGKKYIIIYNGELYNTQELRNELIAKGYHFQTRCDTEVLLLSFIEWGPECLNKINGIFVFAVWDGESIFLARDRLGVKPLFYALPDGNLIFGSELKALLSHPYIEPLIDAEGLAEIFALGPSRTPGNGVFKNIKELRPGYFLSFSRKGLMVQKYWSLESKPHEDGFEKTVAKVRELVIDAIERQLVSDVPICTFLSGGLDSSIITSIAAIHCHNKGERLSTYSIDYVDNEKFFKVSEFQPNSDSVWVEQASKALNTQHYQVLLDTPQIVEALEEAVIARDLPGMADIDSSLYLFCKEIKKNATVALSGECADEVFGGYPWFYKSDLLELENFPWLRAVQEREKILSKELLTLINPLAYAQKRYQETLAEVPRLEGESFLENRRRAMFYMNFTWFMANLLDRKDRMSMANGLEVRVPFCDHRIVEYVWNIPWEMKFYLNREKGLLRKAMEGFLPEEILWRKKSPYPKTHNPSYLNAVVKKLMTILNDRDSLLPQLVNVSYIKELMQTDLKAFTQPWFGQLMTGPQLLAYLIQVDIWLKKYKVRIV
ncbi:MAG: asparagine synthase (glutamine-hydrolyzing) [Clostridia bacterium]|nr:asparagine synthase (glutamine-hydrolyzing) [Clostridia bacterium]